ncbi:uncharacterized protein [Temnothorax longispinosus]|uniref:uncharacterized protein n=1 Tax=Temnothorax longispinosus TaxID=300112 RepID=UPI003A999B14
MCEQIKIIERCYKALEYDINKQEALNKISALHYELKFKDPDNFSDRFSQTASIIERNLSVFKSACDHVDIVTTILNYLYNVGVKLMINDKCTADDLNMIYIMYIVCKEPEIPCFLKAALINNSKWESVDHYHRPLISNCVYEMIVLDDSDLHAVISYLRITPSLLLKIRKIFVQESIKQKFLWILKKNFQNFYTFLDLHISTFRTRKELHSLPLYTVNLASIKMVSIWSEDITAAKELASTLRTDITFINAHFEFCPDIKFSWKWSSSMFDLYKYFVWDDLKYGDKIDPNKHVGSVYNLFYNGGWQKPVKNGYWVHNGNTYANATKEDMLSCVKSAEEASKSWSILPIVSRRKILENLATTLECHGY